MWSHADRFIKVIGFILFRVRKFKRDPADYIKKRFNNSTDRSENVNLNIYGFYKIGLG